jgi:exosome complex component CSL4
MGQDNFAFPGSHVGSEEEAAPGKGTYQKDSDIYSALAGRVVREHGEVSVLPKKEVIRIQPGQIVYGIVADVMEALALIEIEPLARGRERFVPPSDYGVLRVMNIREGFVPSAKDELKRGDLIKARVEDISKGISLSTKGFDFGVVRAFCSVCRHEMGQQGQGLFCPKCGSRDRRKLSKSYGQAVMLNEIKF